MITESLVFGTAISTPVVVALTESVLIEVGVIYASLTVAWVWTATSVATDITITYPFTAVETVPV
jgi:hypothetical protein